MSWRIYVSVILSAWVFLGWILTIDRLDFKRPRPEFNQIDDWVFKGEWVLRPGVTQKEVENAEKYFGQFSPKKHFHFRENVRKDGRCGVNYPRKGYPAQCKRNSRNSCCNDLIGICSSGPENCSCQKFCRDYNNSLKHAALYTWKEHVRPMVDFNRNTTCEFLSRYFTSVTFIGDSLMRHFYGGMLIRLTNDTRLGAMVPFISERNKVNCHDERQFMQNCRHLFSRRWQDVFRNKKYCPFSKTKIKSQFVEAYSVLTAAKALRAIEKMTDSNPLIVLNAGLHDAAKTSLILREYLAPILDAVRGRIKNPTIVWVGSSPHSDLKASKYLAASQSNPVIVRYNRQMRQICRLNGLFFFDLLEMIRQTYSFDGTHYGIGLNTEKFKVFIKFLREFVVKNN